MLGFSPIRIAIDRSNSPYSFEDAGALGGTSVSLISAAFRSQGVEAAFTPVDGPMAQAIAVASGRVDAAADFSATGWRRRWYCFSHHYAVEELQVFTRRAGPLWSGLRHFHGVLGVKAQSAAQEFLVRHSRAIPLMLTETTEQVLEALWRDCVQAIVLPRAAGRVLIPDDGDNESAIDLLARGAPFGTSLLALASLCGQTDALDRFNAGLESLRHR